MADKPVVVALVEQTNEFANIDATGRRSGIDRGELD